MAKLDHYLALAVRNRASDLHLVSGEKVRLRVDGDLLPQDGEALSAAALQEMFFEVLTSEERNRFLSEMNLDKSYSVPQIGSFRLNLFMNRRGMAAVLRAIPQTIPSMEDLNLPEVVQRFAALPKGLVLVTGPTGSGKSTTLAAMVDQINSTQAGHILTIEDPIEFIHPSKVSLVNQREIGHSTSSFAEALKYALREDPDVILIGELRDLETMALALSAAETGHLVLATLHTRGAASSIDRILDSFPAAQQPMMRTMLAESLVGVVSQTLLKRADGQGRVAAYEIMVVTKGIANLIREGKIFQIETAMQTGRKEGMVLLSQSVKALLDQKIVTKEEAQSYLGEQSAAQALQMVNPPIVPRPAVPKAEVTQVEEIIAPVVESPLEVNTTVLDLTDDSLDIIRQEIVDVEIDLEVPKIQVPEPTPLPPTPMTAARRPLPPPLKKKAS